MYKQICSLNWHHRQRTCSSATMFYVLWLPITHLPSVAGQSQDNESTNYWAVPQWHSMATISKYMQLRNNWGAQGVRLPVEGTDRRRFRSGSFFRCETMSVHFLHRCSSTRWIPPALCVLILNLIGHHLVESLSFPFSTDAASPVDCFIDISLFLYTLPAPELF